MTLQKGAMMITIGAEPRLLFGRGEDTVGLGSSSNNTVHKPVIAHGSLSETIHQIDTAVVMRQKGKQEASSQHIINPPHKISLVTLRSRLRVWAKGKMEQHRRTTRP